MNGPPLPHHHHTPGARLIGSAPAIQALRVTVDRFAPYARAALISGEAGTGKGFLARTLHSLGPYARGRVVELRCAMVADAPWGEVLGAALDTRDADDVTLLVDDIDEAPKALQAHLLGCLDALLVGQARPVVAALIATTTRDLRAETEAGRFRTDLFYRLDLLEFHLPPLRERLEDIEALGTAFIGEIAPRLGRPASSLTAGAVRVLRRMPWPGNLRELHNVIERACILAEDAAVGESAIRAAVAATAVPPTSHRGVGEGGEGGDARERLDEAQRAHVRAVLNRVHGNKSIAARHLGVSRRSLYRLLDRLGA